MLATLVRSNDQAKLIPACHVQSWPAKPGAVAEEAGRDGCRPARYIAVRAQVAAAGAAGEPDVDRRQAGELEEVRDLLNLLAGRRLDEEREP